MNKVSEAIWMNSGLNQKIAASVQNNSRYSIPSRNDMFFSYWVNIQSCSGINIL